ncbi:hypothetical protein GCM10009821_04840 [Aeromicrobium halocynthiae]|uniref:Uncharacterized protein n=1 Tax=Aeromicrobium halocynthiae TaxID=560557 RepID=A0ABN2VRV5_9ACTN
MIEENVATRSTRRVRHDMADAALVMAFSFGASVVLAGAVALAMRLS